jgi:hypothetical protein
MIGGLRKTFEQTINNKLTEEESVNGTLSPLWLEIVNLFQTFDNEVQKIDIDEIMRLLSKDR